MTLIPHKASRNYSAKDFSIPSMIIAHIKIHVWNEKNRIWRWTVLPTTLLALSFYNMNINISHTCLWINQVDFLLTSQKEQEKQNPRCSKEEYLVWNLINVKKLVWFWNHWFLLNILTIINLMPERGRYLIDPAMSQSDVPWSSRALKEAQQLVRIIPDLAAQ